MALLHQESSQTLQQELSQDSGPVKDEIKSLFVAPASEKKGQFSADTDSMPGITVQETETDVVLWIETSCINIKDLDVKVSEEAVFIKGKRRFEFSSDYQGVLCTEFHYCTFQQVIPLPALVHNGEIRATCTDGMLCLTLPKFENARHAVVSLNLPKAIAG